ncbi:MAG: anhydro-N-acetylmuramic acid kinase [Rhodospirillales bacterium]
MPRTIGLMSGTSLDGVDAAWIDTDGESVASTGPTITIPYDRKMRIDLRRALDIAPSLPADSALVKSLVERLTDTHAQAVQAIGRTADLIGFHGQTLLHRPEQRRTWQIGDGQALAERLGIPVAFDFRSADVAAGGQGAPLVPVFHAALARDLPKPLAVLNIGGVANVTWIGADGTLVACDTGPGNGPLDDWTLRHTGQAFDRDGALALSGRADTGVLERLLANPYFGRPAPKSLDRLDFGSTIRDSGLEALSAADGAATLAAFTARAVVATVLPAAPIRWLVCGGGRHNTAIMAALCAALPAPVEPVEAVGWNGDALEAQCFGFLAARAAVGLPLSFPGTTGAPTAMTGGRLVHP